MKTLSLPPFVRWVAVFLLLGLFGWMAVSVSHEHSATFDEPYHLTGGYSIWHTGDFRLHPEHGDLPQRWSAWPLTLQPPKFPALNQPAWQQAVFFEISHQFFYTLGNDFTGMLLRGRIMIALFGVALGLVIFAWSRQLFGEVGGLISLAMFAFSPTMLAHGGLITSDMTAALFFTLALWRWWRLLHRLTPLNVLTSSLAMTGLCLAKMSWFIIGPVALLLVGVRLLSPEPLPIHLRRAQVLVGRWRQLLAFSVVIPIHAIIIVAGIWLAYGGRYSAFDPATHRTGHFHESWSSILTDTGPVKPVINFARDHRLLPEAYLYGFTFVIQHSQQRRAFMNGQYSLNGWWSFFPYTLLVKTPLALFAMLGLAGAATGLCWRTRKTTIWASLYRGSPLLIFAGTYWALAIFGNLNIGHRHILPTYPVMFILAGGAALWVVKRPRIGTSLIVIIIGWLIVESIRIRPSYLAYFNQLAGGPSQGYRHLSDSSLDWGQDLPGLKRWLDQHAPAGADRPPVFLSYFGSAEPDAYRIKANWLPNYADLWHPVDHVPLTGGIYCISATMLQQVYTPFMGHWAAPYEQAYQQTRANLLQLDKTRDEPHMRQLLIAQYGADFWNQQIETFQQLQFARLCAYLRQRSPDDMIGYSILIYRLTDQQIQKALNGPPAELTQTVEVKGLPTP